MRKSSSIRLATLFCATLLLGGLIVTGCSGAKKKSDSQSTSLSPSGGGNSSRKVLRLIPFTLRMRRPPVAGADPKAGPGGADYVSHPFPNQHLDCETAEAIFKDIPLTELRGCLATLAKAGPPHLEIRYRLKRSFVPELELDGLDSESPDAPPACLKKSLPRIPVPREIFFQAPYSQEPTAQEDLISCFSSRLNVEANETSGVRLPTNRVALRLDFSPISPSFVVPKDDAETRMLLLSWAISPFWQQEEMRYLPAVIVPDTLCRQCIGEKNLWRLQGPPPVLWPSK